ncbi:MAG: DUF1501 domain-containing protein [Hyphomicrobiaceae bacterium]
MRRPSAHAVECSEALAVSRRSLLSGSAASLALWSLLPRSAIAGTRDPRLLTVILRGGLDGIAMIAPVGDPDYVRLRGGLAIPATGPTGGMPLEGLFALNHNMPFLHGLYGKREALMVHAVATPYRGRSHFDGQDVLESGMPGVGRLEDGWMNRALAGLPAGGSAAPKKGLAMGAVVPLVMRGAAPVLSWIPKAYNLPLRESTIARLAELYGITDPKLAKAFADGLEIDRISTAAAGMGAAPPATPVKVGEIAKAAAPAAPPPPRPFRDFVDAAETAAKFLSTADGPRIGALSYNGWDTHANEGAVQGQLGNRLAGLDAAIRALHDGLGPVWKDTVVLIVTEFGRTARVNGTDGTDHGTGMVALLVGGAVKGGRVIADWPGLADANLFENRDLKPTRDLRTVLKGVLRDHLGIPDGALSKTVFPDSAASKSLDGLIA